MQIKHVCLSGMRRGDGGSRARELSAGKGLPRRDSTVVRSTQHVARMPLPERTRGQENDQTYNRANDDAAGSSDGCSTSYE
jgi:hypothetical protein